MKQIDIDTMLGMKLQLRACINEMKSFDSSKSVESTQKNELIDQIDKERDLLLRAEIIIRNIEGNMREQRNGVGELMSELIGNCACMRKSLDEKKGVLERAGDYDGMPCCHAEPGMSFDELVLRMDILYEALSSALTEYVYAAPMSADLADLFSD